MHYLEQCSIFLQHAMMDDQLSMKGHSTVYITDDSTAYEIKAA